MPEPLEIPIEVDADEASRVLEEFSDDVEELADRFQPVELDVDTSDAERGIDDVRDDLEKLGDEEIKPEIKPELDQGAVDKARKDVSDRVSEGGGEAGQRFGAGFARDFGGIVNEEAAGIGGDLTDGISTAFEAFGVSQSLAGPLTAALGIGTVVVAAATTLWQAMNKGAEEYKKSLDEAITRQGQLASGQLTQAVEEMEKKLAPMADTMSKFGISVGEATEFIMGGTDELGLFNSEMDKSERWEETNKRAKELGVTNGTLNRSFEDTRSALLTMRRANDESETSFAHSQQRMFEIISAMEQTGASTDQVTGALYDLAAQTKGPTRDAIINHIGLLNGIPQSKITEILTDTDPNDIAQTKAVIDNLTKARTIPLTVSVDVNAGQIAQQVATAVALAGGSVQGVQTYQARNGPIG